MITFVVLGVPVQEGSMKPFTDAHGQARMRHEKGAKLEEWRTAVAWSARAARKEFYDSGPVMVEATFWLPKPAKPKDPSIPVVPPDLDKLARSCGDAMSGVLYADDAQITDWILHKRYPTALTRERPGAMIRVGRPDDWEDN